MAVAAERTESKPRQITILGSTGSIGCNTLDIIEHHDGAFSIEALTAHRSVDALAAQALKFRPRLAVIGDESAYSALKDALSGSGVAVAAGAEGLVEAACMPADWIMAGIVGTAGLEPTLAAVRRGAVVALANKECLVSAGQLMMDEVYSCGATLLPVDSEHNAIFQVFDFDQPETVERVVLTASGGPFRTVDRAVMADVTPAQAIAHPNWDMGAKISVDSATLMNKGLELIEAHYLFGLPPERIEVLIHPQSVVHSMVVYIDGSVLGQLGTPDMRTPIAHALGWPERISAPTARLDLAKIGQLTFEPPDHERFPALRLAGQALQSGGAAPTILNAANEVAVQGFLAGRIGFLDIARIVEETLSNVRNDSASDLAEIRYVDGRARAAARDLLTRP